MSAAAASHATSTLAPRLYLKRLLIYRPEAWLLVVAVAAALTLVAIEHTQHAQMPTHHHMAASMQMNSTGEVMPMHELDGRVSMKMNLTSEAMPMHGLDGWVHSSVTWNLMVL